MGEAVRKGEPIGPALATRLTVAYADGPEPLRGGRRAVVIAPALQRGWLRAWAAERGYTVVGETDADGQVEALVRHLRADTVVVGPLTDGRAAVATVAALRPRLADVEIVVPEVVPVTGELDALSATQARQRITALIEENGIEPVFQPVFDLVTRQIIGVEALSRFPQPEGDRPPSSWFEEAESVGLGQELEMAALRAVLAEIGDLPKTWWVSVNLSSRTFSGTMFSGVLDDLSGRQIVVELTSPSWGERDQPLRRAILRSRDARVRVAVDDVGGTARSLVRAFELRPDIVKIDPTLVRHIDHSQIQQAVVRDLVSFADESGTTLVAEGIERLAEIEMLLSLDVRFGQGYLLAPPMSLADVRAFGMGVIN